jgi:hypothetical protein
VVSTTKNLQIACVFELSLSDFLRLTKTRRCRQSQSATFNEMTAGENEKRPPQDCRGGRKKQSDSATFGT